MDPGEHLPEAELTMTFKFSVEDLVRLQSSLETVPSKRQNRNKSGRAGRRAYNSRQALQAVGGFSQDFKASLAKDGAALCIVVDHRRGYRADGSLNRL